jgi:hypothetical protein
MEYRWLSLSKPTVEVCVKTTPTVQELKRQINTLAFERVGLSESQALANDQFVGDNSAISILLCT